MRDRVKENSNKKEPLLNDCKNEDKLKKQTLVETGTEVTKGKVSNLISEKDKMREGKISEVKPYSSEINKGCPETEVTDRKKVVNKINKELEQELDNAVTEGFGDSIDDKSDSNMGTDKPRSTHQVETESTRSPPTSVVRELFDDLVLSDNTFHSMIRPKVRLLHPEATPAIRRPPPEPLDGGEQILFNKTFEQFQRSQ